MIVKIEKTNINVSMPEFKTDGAAGCDLSAYISGDLLLKSGATALVPTGIKISIPSNKYFALLTARSGLSVKHGITLVNGVGVIDSDYTGEIKAGLINLSGTDYVIKSGDRIAQLIFVSIERPELEVVGTLPETERGSGGFGSTGV